MEKGDEWYLGGLKTIPSASDFDQMFPGRIYEFILLKNVVGETEVKSIFDSMICSSITEDSISTVSETYYPPASSVIQQVPTGNQILTGYTNTPTTSRREWRHLTYFMKKLRCTLPKPKLKQFIPPQALLQQEA